MLRFKALMHILPKRSGAHFTGKVRYIGYSEDDFEKVMITKKEDELKQWTKLKIFVNERSTDPNPSNINPVDMMSRTYRSKRTITLAQWKRQRLVSDNYSFDKKRESPNSKNNFIQSENRKLNRISGSVDELASSKSKNSNRPANNNVRGKERIYTNFRGKERIDTNFRGKDRMNTDRESRFKIENRLRASSAEKYNNAETDKKDDGYYYEFMKLIEKQKEAPFVFAPFIKHHPEIDMFLEKLAAKLKLSKRDGRTFPGLGIEGHLAELLAAGNITKPLPVQIEAIPEIMLGKNIIIESVTGSGKTLAFLLPMIQQLGDQSCSNLIIVPTRELATQIYKEALKYGIDKKCISRHVSGVDDNHDKNLNRALKESKILIGTPKRLLEVIECNIGHFKQVRRIVIDEADKLLPVSSARVMNWKVNLPKKITKVKPTEKILAMLLHFRQNAQLIATSATISSNLILNLQDMGFSRTCEVIKLLPEDFKHGKVPDNIQHFFSVVPDSDDFSKVRFCSRLFDWSKEKSILLFINRNESVERVVDELKDIGLNARALYKELLLPAPAAYDNFLRSFQEGEIQVVVSTEETVRGIDFPFLNDVYLTFVPNTPEQYVHIAGRVGRLGRPGKVITVIGESSAAADKKHLKKRYSALDIKARMLQL